MIPKIIHQIWFSPDGKYPEKYDFCQESWSKINPNYQYILWDEKSSQHLIEKEFPDFINTYNQVKDVMVKTDLLRILIGYHYGGVYADLDVECLRPIDEWVLDFDKINIPLEPKEHNPFMLGCATFCLKEKNEKLLKLLEFGLEKFEIEKQWKIGYNMEAFGPKNWTQFQKKHPEYYNIIDTKLMFPIPDTSISSKLDELYKDIIKKKNFRDAYCVHYWDHLHWPRPSILDKYYNDLKS